MAGNRLLPLALCALLTLVVGCDNAPVPTATITPMPTATTAPQGSVGPTATAQTQDGMTPTPYPTTGGSMEPTGIEFQVWQDFMPGRRDDGPPLHATVVFFIEGVDTSSGSGSITLRRASGEEIATAPLELVRWADDLGLKQPGPQRVTFTMTSTPATMELKEGEPIKGTASVRLGDTDLKIELPETPLEFTH
ncbi:MAG TPA: hypothetical protein VEX13_10495 [Chloroflexia bacterium]|nr:hypothetical protein [Chloroflexia bacterium]